MPLRFILNSVINGGLPGSLYHGAFHGYRRKGPCSPECEPAPQNGTCRPTGVTKLQSPARDVGDIPRSRAATTKRLPIRRGIVARLRLLVSGGAWLDQETSPGTYAHTSSKEYCAA